MHCAIVLNAVTTSAADHVCVHWLQVTCSEPYEWKDPTISEWEFSQKVRSLNGAEPLHVSTTLRKGAVANGPAAGCLSLV